MTITWQHMSITVLIAVALHGGIAMWLVLPSPEPLSTPPLRVSLLAAVAETTIYASAAILELPTEPVSQPVSAPIPALDEFQPVVHKALVKPQPMAKPVSMPQVPTPQMAKPVSMLQVPTSQLVNNVSASEQPSVPRQEIVRSSPIESNTLNKAASAQYEQLLVAWLEKYKNYPRHAKRLRIEGEGMLRILINRTGHTQQITLEQSTGNRLLDKAALEMAQRANPFPPIPENDPRRELEFIVPVVFALH